MDVLGAELTEASDCRSLRRPPPVAGATGDGYDGDPHNPLPDAGPALCWWRLGRRPLSGNMCLPMPVQCRFADAELRSDIPKCEACLQSLVDGLMFGMRTDSAQPSHLSRNNSTMPRKTLALDSPGHASRSPQTHDDLTPIRPRYVTSLHPRLSIHAL
jgi:hypothetical protein